MSPADGGRRGDGRRGGGASTGRGGGKGRGGKGGGGQGGGGAGRAGPLRRGASSGRGAGEARRGGDTASGRARRGGRRGGADIDAEGGEQVEGRQAVRELLRAGRRRVHYVIVAESSEHSGLLDEVIELAERRSVPVRRVGRDRVDAMAVTDAPQGVVAVADAFPEVELVELVGHAPGRSAPFLVVLDGVTDPHNVGAVMRSALSAGVTGVVMGRHRSARLSPTTTKAAAGAVEWLPVALVAGIPGALSELQDAGIWTVGLDADGSDTLWNLEVATEPIALVLGAEGAGLSRLTRQRCEVVASIPMHGPLASLNVSAAAALGCFEVARRRAARAEA